MTSSTVKETSKNIASYNNPVFHLHYNRTPNIEHSHLSYEELRQKESGPWSEGDIIDLYGRIKADLAVIETHKKLNEKRLDRGICQGYLGNTRIQAAGNCEYLWETAITHDKLLLERLKKIAQDKFSSEFAASLV
jgi:hypothetical protein